jgi:hypothetical protein
MAHHVSHRKIWSVHAIHSTTALLHVRSPQAHKMYTHNIKVFKYLNVCHKQCLLHIY